MEHVNPKLLQEFLQIINTPLFTNGKKQNYDKHSKQIGLFIDGVLIQWILHEIWARFST